MMGIKMNDLCEMVQYSGIVLSQTVANVKL